MIPNNAQMLLSFVNMKLRDFYKNLDDLCYDLDINQDELIDKMADNGYMYDSNLNRFRPIE